MMADGESQQTYPNSRRVIRSLTANLNMRTKAARDEFLAFFNYHAQGQEFLFIDKAHTDENKRPTEFLRNSLRRLVIRREDRVFPYSRHR